MSFYRVKAARFAETIRIGDGGEEVRYVNIEEKKYERYTMIYHDNLLWITDAKTKKIYTTSNANLRMLEMFEAPPKCIPEELRKKIDKE